MAIKNAAAKPEEEGAAPAVFSLTPLRPPLRARARSADGAHITASFYNGGPAEQGVTRTPLTLPVGPYMAGLAALEAQGGAEASLKAAGSPDSGFPLDWDLLRSWGPPSAPYLAQARFGA